MAVQNDSLLEKILEHARKIGNREDMPLTAERYLVAVIDALDGTWDLAESAQLPLLQRTIREANIDVGKMKSYLMSYINENRSGVFLDDLYMKKKLAEAQHRAEAGSEQVLTAQLLLQVILSNPSDAIRKGMAESAAQRINEVSLKQLFEELEGQKLPQMEIEEKRPQKETPKPRYDNKSLVEALTEETKRLQERLSGMVFGQDNAINVVTSGYFQARLLAMTDKKRHRPSATYLFAGPPGVGKTFLAECFAKALELPFQRFDMSEYSDKEANIEFCGSDKVYKNGKAGNVTGFVEQNPKCVLLFDEIEKAHINVIHLFLQLLDAGRLRDNYTDTEVSFKDAILIFTTNAGKNLYEDSEHGDFSTVSRKVILKALQKDVNPSTGIPYFPAAICSRFASGNVVMFNHMAAHDLRHIARREVLRQAANFTKEIGIHVDIDERVYTALLFAEGGAADARTVRSRAECFFNNELFELFRLVGAQSAVGSIDRIDVTVELPKEDPELMELFVGRQKPEVLVFSSKKVASRVCAVKDCVFCHASTVSAAQEILKKRDIKLILLDISHGRRGNQCGYLNVEDMASSARDFFRYIREREADVPVYLLQTEQHIFGQEEKVSFLRQGVRGVLALDGGEEFAGQIRTICANLHQQQSMNKLAKANKLVSFETAQTLLEDGTVAQIRLFDFAMAVALDAEDSKNVLSSVSKPNVSFQQVIGAEDAKKELQYFVEYLKNPKKYQLSGVSAPKGVLLYGPPGTGKTMLAKAMASESDVTFLTAEGNQFLKRYVGEGPEKVHELFRTARKYAPAILFIDEIDAIAKERRGGDGDGGIEETLTALLTEMDGFKNDTSKPVFVLAATNFDVEPGGSKSLDPALMRRFDRRVLIDLPNRDDRVRYMNMKCGGNPVFQISQEKIKNIAVRSTGMSLAALESVFELALRSVLRQGGGEVTDEVLDEAFEIFNSGDKKNWDISQLERVARHEAGHAFMCWHGGQTPSYVTVVARANHGGYMQHGDSEGKAIYTRDELLARIRTSLGGRAAEIVYYGPEDGISTGASGDLDSATRVAQSMICSYGMDEKFGIAVIDPQAARMGALADEVRGAVNQILSEQMEKTVALLSANRDVIDVLVEQLISKNHLSGAEIKAIFDAFSNRRGMK